MKGPRVYTVEQVNELVPDLIRIFDQADAIRKKIQTTKIRLNALEVIWGEGLQKSDCPDHKEFEHYIEELKNLEEAFSRELAKVGEMGGQVKSFDPGLADFYGVRDGYLVFLCWRRGEESIDYWHDLESGYAGRQPL